MKYRLFTNRKNLCNTHKLQIAKTKVLATNKNHKMYDKRSEYP